MELSLSGLLLVFRLVSWGPVQQLGPKQWPPVTSVLDFFVALGMEPRARVLGRHSAAELHLSSVTRSRRQSQISMWEAVEQEEESTVAVEGSSQ